MDTVTGRQQLLRDRQTGLGGSDIAGLFNLPPYGCRLRLFKEKSGQPRDIPDKDSGPMKLGRHLEPLIAAEYEARTGREVIERGLIRHPQYPEALVHIDREIRDPAIPGPGVLEIKALGRGMYYQTRREGLADGYVLQLVQGMLVTGFQWGAFCCLNRDNADIVYWDVPRNEELCDLVLAETLAFWKLVQDGGPQPALLAPDDPRCTTCSYGPSCQGAALMESVATDKKIVTDNSLIPLQDEYRQRKALFDEAEALLDETKEELKTRIGDRGAVLVAGKPMYYRGYTEYRWSTEAMAEGLSLARGKVDYDGTFLPEAPAKVEGKFKKGSPRKSLRVYC